MKKNTNILILFFLFFVIQNCSKEEESTAPTIKLVSVEPTVVKEYTDSIVFVIHYQDNDGDIGIPDADKNSLWLKDLRLDNADEYFIAPLAPLDEKVAIEGEFKITLKNTFKLGNATEEKTSFTIWIKDRAGSKSNVITSPEITITD